MYKIVLSEDQSEGVSIGIHPSFNLAKYDTIQFYIKNNTIPTTGDYYAKQTSS